MQSNNLRNQIDNHIAAIEASSNRTTILWHSSRAWNKIVRISATWSCDNEMPLRTKLSEATREALHRAYGLIGGVK